MTMTDDLNKSKEQLIAELAQARQRIKDLERTVSNQTLPSILNQPEFLSQMLPIEASSLKNWSLLQSILNNIPDYVFIKNIEGRIMMCNETAAHIMGFAQPDDLFGKANFDLYPEHLAERADKDAESILQSGSPLINRVEAITDQSGQKLWFLTSKVPWYDQAGQIIGMIEIGRDITIRMNVQKSLVEGEERYRTLVQNMAEGLIQVDNEGTIQFVNRALCEMLGFEEEELVGTDHLLLLTNASDQDFMEDKLQIRKNDISDEYQIYLQKKSGELIWVQVSAAPVKDAKGNIIGSIGVHTDITDRREAEVALRKSEERFRLLAENAQDVIFRYEFRPTSRVSYISSAVTKLLDYTPEEFYANPFLPLRIIHPDDKQNLSLLPQSFQFSETPRILRWIHKSGKTVWTEQSNVPIFDTDGGLIAVEGVIRDITARRHLEEQLQQSAKMEAVGRLAGGIAHDFNNLLTVITGYSELLLSRRITPQDPIRREVEEIYKASERAGNLTRRLLTFSRKQIIQPTLLNLNDVVIDMENLLRRLIGEHINLQTNLADDLNDIEADPGQLEQVLVNLIVNARDAMPDGGRLSIETRNFSFDQRYQQFQVGVKPGEYVLLTISDTGHGIDETIKPHIFEPFFTTKTPDEGTGLGLATLHGIVTQNKGIIEVESKVGDGAIFKIYWPQSLQSATEIVERQSIQSSNRGTETILLVEDEEMVRNLTREILLSEGYQVLEAQDGLEALQIFNQHQENIRLLLTDFLMPGGITGKILAERLMNHSPTLKILYMSGYSDERFLDGITQNQEIFLQKPFLPNALTSKVRQILDGR